MISVPKVICASIHRERERLRLATSHDRRAFIISLMSVLIIAFPPLNVTKLLDILLATSQAERNGTAGKM